MGPAWRCQLRTSWPGKEEGEGWWQLRGTRLLSPWQQWGFPGCFSIVSDLGGGLSTGGQRSFLLSCSDFQVSRSYCFPGQHPVFLPHDNHTPGLTQVILRHRERGKSIFKLVHCQAGHVRLLKGAPKGALPFPINAFAWTWQWGLSGGRWWEHVRGCAAPGDGREGAGAAHSTALTDLVCSRTATPPRQTLPSSKLLHVAERKHCLVRGTHQPCCKKHTCFWNTDMTGESWAQRDTGLFCEGGDFILAELRVTGWQFRPKGAVRSSRARQEACTRQGWGS